MPKIPLDMPPCKALVNPENHLVGNRIVLRNGGLGFSSSQPRSNVEHILFGQFAPWVSVTARQVCASFADAIQTVIQIATNKKMIGPKTGRIVAFVANLQAIWNWTNLFTVCESMSLLFLPAHPDQSIATRVVAAGPFKTGIILWNMFEHLAQQCQRILGIAIPGAVSLVLLAILLSTCFAGSFAILARHVGALLGSACVALALVAQRGAFSIIGGKGIVYA